MDSWLLRSTVCVLVLGSGTVLADPVLPMDEALAAEVARLRAMVAAAEVADESWPDSSRRLNERLDEVAADIAAERTLAALHRLSGTHNTIVAFLYRNEVLRRGDVDLETVRSEWKAAAETLEAVDGPSPGVSAAIRAVAEAARSRIRSYHRASLAYAEATEPASGLFYLGRARAFRAWLAFCASLDPGAVGQSPPMRSWRPELEALEAEVLAAFQPPRSIDEHPSFIQLGSTLKLARELDDAGAWYGSLYAYLEARMRLARIGATDVPSAAALAEGLRRVTADLPPERDDSILRIFLQLAADELATVDGDGEVREDARAGAGAVLDAVVPAYFDAIGSTSAPASATPDAARVTVVRWPYT